MKPINYLFSTARTLQEVSIYTKDIVCIKLERHHTCSGMSMTLHDIYNHGNNYTSYNIKDFSINGNYLKYKSSFKIKNNIMNNAYRRNYNRVIGFKSLKRNKHITPISKYH